MSNAHSFYCVVQFAPPGGAPRNIGVLLYEAPRKEVFLRFRTDYEKFATDEDAEVLALLADDLAKKFGEVDDPIAVIEYMEHALSNAIRISRRVEIALTGDPEKTLDEVFRKSVTEDSPDDLSPTEAGT